MTFQTQTIRLESSDSDKENQSPSTTNEVASETLCDPGFGTVWPSSLLFSSSSNFTAAASPIPLPSFVSPTNPPTFALLPSAVTVPQNNVVASVASKATFEVRTKKLVFHLHTQHMNVLRNGRFVTDTKVTNCLRMNYKLRR